MPAPERGRLREAEGGIAKASKKNLGVMIGRSLWGVVLWR